MGLRHKENSTGTGEKVSGFSDQPQGLVHVPTRCPTLDNNRHSMLTSVRSKEESILAGVMWPQGSLRRVFAEEAGNTGAKDALDAFVD